MSQLKDDLQAVRDLLTPRERWTQRVLARNVHGFGVLPGSPGAVCWCLSGGMQRVIPSIERRRNVRAALGLTCMVADFNDTHTHEEVLARLDTALDKVTS